jgi:uncharacterized surface protein with fasciclin (FAS1) repeats
VFAPTDDAFGKLPDGIVNALIKPENKEDLTSILTYHVLVGKIMSTDLSDGESHNGERRRSNGSFKKKVFINDAEVVLADVTTDNGVIHAVNKVIMPA